MNKVEYLKALSSLRTDQREAALKSDYVPKTSEEINAAIKAAMISKPSLQDALFDHLYERTPINIAMPAYLKLVTESHSEEAIIKAIAIIRELETQEVTEALMLAASHESADVQITAISALANHGGAEVANLLYERIAKPDQELGVNYKKRAEEVKKAAIESIGFAGQDDTIQYLLNIVFNNLEYKLPVERSLIRINTPTVAEMLLNVFDDPSKDIDTSISNLELRVFLVRTIGSVPSSETNREKYRPLLYETYEALLRDRKSDLSDQIVKLFDNQTGAKLVELTRSFSNQANILEIIMKDLTSIELKMSFTFWLQIFDLEFPIVRQQAIFALAETVKMHSEEFSQFLLQSILDGNRPAHESKSLSQVITHLPPEKRLAVADQIALGIDDTAPETSAIIIMYIEEIWNSLSDRIEYFNILYVNVYLKNARGRTTIRKFISGLWEQSPASLRIAIFDTVLVVTEGKNVSSDVMTAVSELIAHLLNTSTNPVELMRVILSKIGNLSNKGDTWVVLENAVNSTVSTDNNLTILFRETLRKEGEINIPESAIPILINFLAKQRTAENIGAFANFISPEYSQEIQLTSLSALGYQEPTKIEAIICEKTLRRREESIVISGIELLANISAPTTETIIGLKERSEDSTEKKEKIRKIASNALVTLTKKHLERDISKHSSDKDFTNWIDILLVIGLCECEEKLERLLLEHHESPKRRVQIISAIARCTNPNKSIPILESYQENERDPNVIAEINTALDTLEGHPDRADIELIETTTGEKIDKLALLGQWHLEDLFDEPETRTILRSDLLRIKGNHSDSDLVVTCLDSMSDELIQRLFVADTSLDPTTVIKVHGNRIGRLASLPQYKVIHAAANTINTYRGLAQGLHPRDKSGFPRPGVSDVQRDQSLAAFHQLFVEIVRVLRKFKENKP